MSVIFISANTGWNIVNFRKGLVQSLIKQGHKVYFLTPKGPHDADMVALGGIHVPFAIERDGMNPLKDAGVFLRYLFLFIRYRPAFFLAYTTKPNIYGGLAAHLTGVKAVHNISGLGYSFIRGGSLLWLVTTLYKGALKKAYHIFFQNDDDKQLFQDYRILRQQSHSILPGSGVDIDVFHPQQSTPRDSFTFLMVARLLGDKGVREYVEAARLLKAANYDCHCRLVGPLDQHNPTAISDHEIQTWHKDGLIEYLGETTDVRPYWTDADCAILPSYREGAPKSLIEAAAMGVPAIATDVPGCRYVVQDGKTGFLVPAKDAPALAEAMKAMIALSDEARNDMGQAARQLMVSHFSEAFVISAYHKILEKKTDDLPNAR